MSFFFNGIELHIKSYLTKLCFGHPSIHGGGPLCVEDASGTKYLL
jgi:hypothetical protein